MRRRTLNKYGAVKVEKDGWKFDSKAEARRYDQLRLLQMAGEISDLTVDKKALRFKLGVNGKHICNYTGDFSYVEKGQRVIEDVKGVKTRDYVIRRKLMEAIHGISIREIN